MRDPHEWDYKKDAMELLSPLNHVRTQPEGPGSKPGRGLSPDVTMLVP